MNKQYHNLIFTNHSLDRIKLRSISQESVAKVLSHPDETYPDEKPGTIKFIRTLNDRTIHVIATYLKDQKKWLVISVWVRGEEDPQSLVWQLIIFPFKLLAKVAGIMWAYRKKNR
jgi:hypothetical protein